MRIFERRPSNSSHASSSRTDLTAALAELQELGASSNVQAVASHSDILNVYKENARKTNDPALQFEFCCFLFEYAASVNNKNFQLQYQMEAMEWLKRLANMNATTDAHLYIQAECQFRLAEYMRLGMFGERDMLQSWKLYEMAAKKGHSEACYRAGIACELGIGRKVNLSRALLYYRKSSGMIHFPSMFKLITIYAYHGAQYQVSKSSFESFKWLKIVATHTLNHPNEANIYALAALYELGMWYAEGPPRTAPIPDFTLDHEYAIELIYESGRRGYSPAAFKLGEIFERGLYGVAADDTSALFWYNRLLKHSNAGDDNFVALQDWKISAQRRISDIHRVQQKLPALVVETATVKTQQKHGVRAAMTDLQRRITEVFSPRPADASHNGDRILAHLSQRKKLRRMSVPAPIDTKNIAKPRPLSQAVPANKSKDKSQPIRRSKAVVQKQIVQLAPPQAQTQDPKSMFLDIPPPPAISMTSKVSAVQPSNGKHGQPTTVSELLDASQNDHVTKTTMLVDRMQGVTISQEAPPVPEKDHPVTTTTKSTLISEGAFDDLFNDLKRVAAAS
eukprot:Partr_v1_DN27592_c1_g1_i2_m30414